MEFWGLYIVIINLAMYLLFAYDKKCAIKGKWRVSEFTLLSFSILGGSLGALGGIYLLRHKTKHLKFTISVPLILTLHILLLIINL